jgi:basic membrane protein A
LPAARRPTNDGGRGPLTTFQRRLQLALVGIAVLGLAFQAITVRPSAGQSAPGAPSIPRPSFELLDPVPHIAIVYDAAGRGTAGFNALVWEGAKRAGGVFGAELTEITARPSDTDVDREQHLAELVEARNSPILIIDPGYADAVAKVAATDRNIWFGMLDDGSVDAPNVMGILFNEEQGSFLVGAAAALTSKTGNVGFIGAAHVPRLQRYEAGSTAGARAANPEVTVQVVHLSRPAGDDGSGDQAAGREAALTMYGEGADVIFAAAGAAGDGVIQAAHEQGLWAIGVDSDQYLTSDESLRDAILTSMLKRADVATYTIVMEFANGVPKDGNSVFGLDRDAVGYATSGGFVDPIKGQLDAFAARIASGEILVPTTP